MATKTRECSLDELRPELGKVAKEQLSSNEEVLICYESKVRVTLFGLMPTTSFHALIATGHKIIKVSGYDTGVNKVESMCLSDVVSVGEDIYAGEFSARMLGYGGSAIAFPFESREPARKFTNLLRRAIGESKATAPQQNKSASDRLRELAQLHKDGLISEDEFQQKRKEILDQL